MRSPRVAWVRKRLRALSCAGLFAAGLVLGPPALGDVAAGLIGAAIDDPPLASAWRVLRIVNCERCHGKDYEGLAAPSVVAYARTQTRETFLRMLLEGDPPRGMPGYRDNPLVSKNVEGIYHYFLGRANGAIHPTSRPKSRPDASEP